MFAFSRKRGIRDTAKCKKTQNKRELKISQRTIALKRWTSWLEELDISSFKQRNIANIQNADTIWLILHYFPRPGPDYRLKCGDIALNGKPISGLRSVTCRMGSYSVKCHPTQVNAPHLNSSQIGRYSIYLPGRDGRLS